MSTVLDTVEATGKPQRSRREKLMRGGVDNVSVLQFLPKTLVPIPENRPFAFEGTGRKPINAWISVGDVPYIYHLRPDGRSAFVDSYTQEVTLLHPDKDGLIQLDLGRGTDNDIVIPHKGVSRNNTIITQEETMVIVKDCNSVNGTKIKLYDLANLPDIQKKIDEAFVADETNVGAVDTLQPQAVAQKENIQPEIKQDLNLENTSITVDVEDFTTKKLSEEEADEIMEQVYIVGNGFKGEALTPAYLKEQGMLPAYEIDIDGGGLQDVDHLHMHLLGPIKS